MCAFVKCVWQLVIVLYFFLMYKYSCKLIANDAHMTLQFKITLYFACALAKRSSRKDESHTLLSLFCLSVVCLFNCREVINGLLLENRI